LSHIKALIRSIQAIVHSLPSKSFFTHASPTGVLHVASAPVKGIINKQFPTGVDNYNPPDIKTSEVLIRAKPTNGGRIWVNVGAAAADNVGYLLDSGEPIVLSVNNLHSLQFFSDNDDDWVIIVYTK